MLLWTPGFTCQRTQRLQCEGSHSLIAHLEECIFLEPIRSGLDIHSECPTEEEINHKSNKFLSQISWVPLKDNAHFRISEWNFIYHLFMTPWTQLTAVHNVCALLLNINNWDTLCTFWFSKMCWVVGQGEYNEPTLIMYTRNLFCIPKDSSFLFSPQQIENYICNLILKHSKCAFLRAINWVWIAFYISFLYIYYRTSKTEKKLKIKKYQSYACFCLFCIKGNRTSTFEIKHLKMMKVECSGSLTFYGLWTLMRI